MARSIVSVTTPGSNATLEDRIRDAVTKWANSAHQLESCPVCGGPMSGAPIAAVELRILELELQRPGGSSVTRTRGASSPMMPLTQPNFDALAEDVVGRMLALGDDNMLTEAECEMASRGLMRAAVALLASSVGMDKSETATSEQMAIRRALRPASALPVHQEGKDLE